MQKLQRLSRRPMTTEEIFIARAFVGARTPFNKALCRVMERELTSDVPHITEAQSHWLWEYCFRTCPPKFKKLIQLSKEHHDAAALRFRVRAIRGTYVDQFTPSGLFERAQASHADE